MCMKNLLSTFGKHTTRAFCVMAVCGLTWACEDKFPYDNEKPSWLNASIYESLEQGLTDDNGTTHTFNTYLKLLADKDVNPTDPETGEYLQRPLSEVLSRTGSKTVFVAGDDAWEEFFRNNAKLPAYNPWHNATSYENLTVAQKKLLIHTSMLNNAIVMENLASSDGQGTDSPRRGEYMRRFTDVELTDSITYVAPEDLPMAYNYGKEYPVENVYDSDGKLVGQKAYEPEPNYWAAYGPKGNNKGMYMVTDSTANMMLHFTTEHMSNQSVRDEDFKIFMGRERTTDDVHIYDALVLSKNNVAENGYVNIMERVLVPRPNMAELIRTNGNTRIFSHILERFSYPYPNMAVTQAYNDLHKNNPIDTIFTKHYFAKIGPGHTTQLWDSKGNKFQDGYGEVALKFDPGWNEFYDDANDPRPDMAAMFVPSDAALWKYFQPGQEGWDLIETYATDQVTQLPTVPESDNDFENLFKKIDDIPLSTMQALVNVIMFPTFTGSVPSKMIKLRDDAHDDIFYEDDVNGIYDNHLTKDGGEIDTCLLANNGAVYIMNKVYSPADFASVAAPAYISKKNLIMKWAIYNGFVESQDRMHINYFAYLKAMKSQFTFFLPSDKAMLNYYDPVSFPSQKPRVLVLDYTGGKSGLPFTKTLWKYNPATGKRDPSLGTNAGEDTYGRTETIGDEEVVNRLKDILESHTIVHDGTNPIFGTEDQYYIAKNGSAIKITRDPSNPDNIIRVQGGYQLENERYGIVDGDPGTLELRVAEHYDKKNGTTFLLDDGPIIPASKSVYGILTEQREGQADGIYNKFFELTQPSDSMLQISQLVDSKLRGDNLTRALLKYYTFVGASSKIGNGGGVDYNVQFFNNYRYTILVPTNEAIEEAEAHGLPTWETIKADYYSLPKYQDIVSTRTDQYGDPEYYYVTTATAKASDGSDSTYNDTIIVPSSKLEEKFVTQKDVLRLQAKITFLNNFIRGHFLDNSIFVDKSERPEAEYVTSSYDRELGVFVKVLCKRVKQGGDTKLVVRDNYGGPELTVTDNNNIMARDIICYRNNRPQSPTNQSTMNNITIDGSSFAVIHQIPGVLNHTTLPKGSDGQVIYPDFNSESQCKAYLKAHPVVETKYNVNTTESGEEISRQKIVVR